jgi:hypothetical protein
VTIFKNISRSKRSSSEMFIRIVLDDSLAGFAAVRSIREGYPAQILKTASNFYGVPVTRIHTIAHIPASTASRLEKNTPKSARRLQNGSIEWEW